MIDVIDLNYFPRTDDEAEAASLLDRVVAIGKFYDEIFSAMPLSSDEDLDYVLSEINTDSPAAIYHYPNIKRDFKRLSVANRQALNFARNELINAIDEFNRACDVIKNDRRSRVEILKSEGWERIKTGGVYGWKRGSATISDDKFTTEDESATITKEIT